LTLGVVLTLGAVTGGRGQELSGSVTSPNGAPFDGFVLPSVPENWADLPVKLTASQTVSYNSNVNGLPIGFPSVPGSQVGDFTSSTNLGFSTKANVYGQQLFFDATFGVIRYLHHVDFDSNVYSLNAGVDWTVTSRCSGALSVSLSKSPAELTELVGSGVNYTTTTALNETGKCAVSNGYSLVFNAGLTDSTNSNPIDAVNNTRTTLLAAGIEYAKGYSTITALASLSEANFTGRTSADVALGLATVTDFHSFTLNYTRQINDNLSVSALVGLVGTTNGFTLGLPKSLLPIYTLSTTWALTPRLSLNASASKTVAPPSTVIANAETSYDATANLAYQLTPKLTVSAGGDISYFSNTFTSGLVETGFSPIFTGSQRSYALNAGLTYAMTPFLSAALNASYTERSGEGFITPQDLVTVSLNYRPY
jgi:Putative beta-barrel porin 2